MVLWADAVCINQADNLEKSEQVAMMGSIYSAARNVSVCLGDVRHKWETPEKLRNLTTALDKMERQDPSTWDSLCADLKQTNEMSESLFWIKESRWFTRVWYEAPIIN
jgi:hypothetical protein